MAEKVDTKVGSPNASPVKATSIVTGTIGYNRFIDSWQAIDSTGKIVLSSGKQAVIKAFPNFIVKE